MIRLRSLRFFLGLLTVAMLYAACGGGGEESSQGAALTPDYSYTLSWDAPDATIDNTAIDPYEELDHYEIYVSENGTFADSDFPVALVSAVEEILSAEGQYSKDLVTDFDLALLENLPPGNQLYVTIRAVGTDGQKSEFMDAVTWLRS